MKAIKFIGHPVLFMSLFLLLIIEGDQFGGLYLLYLVLALPQGAPYAIVALAGLILVFTAYKIYRVRAHYIKPALYVIGSLVMIFSLVLFFGKGNKWETFSLGIPLFSFIIFALSGLCFLLNALSGFLHSRDNNHTLRMT